MSLLGPKKKYGRTLVYQTVDSFGPIEVVDNKHFRSLHFGSSPKQSEIIKNEPYVPVLEYTEVMLAGLLFEHNPTSVYCMGLGAGTIPYFIHKCFSSARILISETRRDVYSVAKQFFGFPEHGNIHLSFMDGCKFLTKTNIQFNLFFIDAFSSEGLAEEVERQNLTDIIQKNVIRGNVFVINLWKNNYTKIDEIYRLALRNKNIIYLTYRTASSGNIIYFIMTKDKLYQQIKTIGQFIKSYKLAVSLPLMKMVRGIELENNVILRQEV